MTEEQLVLVKSIRALLAHVMGEFDYSESAKALDGVNQLIAEYEADVHPPRMRHIPFGFARGDPLFICFSETERRVWQDALQLRGMYVLPGDALLGQRFGRAVILGTIRHSHDVSFQKWIAENVMTTLPSGGKVHQP